ncbi:hypothetical protein ACX3O0_06190 [Homoserinimonas sp. A447]
MKTAPLRRHDYVGGGARGYLLKGAGHDDIERALATVQLGDLFKLGVTSRAEAVAKARDAGIGEAPDIVLNRPEDPGTT